MFMTVSTILIIGGYGMSLASFTNASPLLFVLLLLCWSHAQIGMATLISGAMQHMPNVATLVAYMIVISTPVLSAVLNSPSSGFANDYPFGMLLVPPLAFSRSLYLVMLRGGDSIPLSSPLALHLFMLFLDGTICFVVGIWFYLVLSDKKWQPLHPLFCCQPQTLSALCTDKTDINQGQVSTRVSSHKLSIASSGPPTRVSSGSGPSPNVCVRINSDLDADAGGLADGAVDPDVVAEERRVEREGIDGGAVVIQNLRKQYPGATKAAVVQLTLRMEYGEVFGLLGPNGAGKTTALSMMSGGLVPSAGTCHVAGYSVTTDVKKVNQVLGFCPQFDVVWDDMTVYQHLAFYSRLKGVPAAKLSVAVQQAAEKVQLDGDALHQTASTLSGGMRRRLSLGISLLADPPVVYLDEPTTGLDPETRREVWDIVQKEQEGGRCMVITTHSMEEADTLCTRIGIMAKGLLRCIGTQQHLKDRFGDGYKLSLQTESASNTDQVIEFLKQEVCTGCSLTTKLTPTSFTFALPKAQVNVAQIFNTMERNKARLGVQNWGITQASLEEVFVKIALESEVGSGLSGDAEQYIEL
jgi:ABC-type multidrug transport system ATPase subunit